VIAEAIDTVITLGCVGDAWCSRGPWRGSGAPEPGSRGSRAAEEAQRAADGRRRLRVAAVGTDTASDAPCALTVRCWSASQGSGWGFPVRGALRASQARSAPSTHLEAA
jgi:hypothetical protein